MSLPHKSIATIESPQFINLQPLDINPLMSKCEINLLLVIIIKTKMILEIMVTKLF